MNEIRPSNAQSAAREGELRILMLEDMPVDAELCSHELKRSGLVFTSRRVDTQADFEQALQTFSPDLILSDFSMPGAFDGLSALDIAREQAPETPFVFVSGTIGEERAVEAMKRGATDYVLKDKLGRLVPVIRRALQERAERMALHRAEDRIARLSRVRTVLSGINAAIVRVKDKQLLYEDACHIAVHEGGFRLAWIGEIADGAQVRPCASNGAREAFLDSDLMYGEESPGSGGLLARVVAEGRHARANDVAADERCARPEERPDGGYRSVAMLPLKVDERVTAVLALYAMEAGVFDDEEMKLLDELSGNLSFALNYIDKASRLDHLAYYDVLTGLPNRTLFRDRLAQIVSRASAEDGKVVAVVADLERFRSINETMGTAAGDAVLRRAAERFARAASDSGTSARITADRFALALHVSGSNGDGVHAIVERLHHIFETPLQIEGEAVRIQAKTGIAVYPEDGDSPDALFANAEAALKKAKVSGDRFVFYAREMNARVAELMRLENKLRVALREEQYILYYQPRISFATGAMCGMEALLRWKSPELGIVPPCDFIPLLEETGLILDVGRWALRRASADAERWRRQGLEVPPVSVNVSAIQLREPGFVEHVTAAIADGESHANSIELELTETMVMADVETNARKLDEIRAAGIRIEIDDFGTGYSSLSYLARLPVDTLKIDRSFIAPMSASPVHMAIVTTVISLARSLNLRVVAEGVETEQQANLLRLLRCDEAQGFLYSKPAPPDEVPALIRRFAAASTSPAPGGGSFAAMAVLPVEAQHMPGAVALRSKSR